MSIDISQYLPVTSTVETVLSDTKVFAGLGLTANLRIPSTTPVLQFSSLAVVGTYFGSSSNEYTAADKYFSTSNTALATPPYIYFGKYIVAATAPFLKSQPLSNPTTMLATLKTITAGQMTVTVNGTAYPTATIDLSAATSLSNACSILQADIWTANTALNSSGANFTITYDSTFNQFVAAIPGTGSTHTMSYFSSTGSPAIATVMGFTLATGAILNQGQDALSAGANLDLLLAYGLTDEWSIAFVDTMSSTLTDAIELAVSAWVDGQNNPADRFNFFCWNNDSSLEVSPDTTSIWYQINQAGYNSTSIFDEVLLNTSDRVFAAMGTFASVDLSQPNSAITLAFKTQTGLATSVTSSTIAHILNGPPQNTNGKSVNYYGNINISGSTDQINWFYGGYTTGKWTYIDNQVAQIWIAFRFQVSLANLFSALGQVPNDPDGYGQIRSALTGEANSFIISGIIGVGVVFSNATVQQLKTNFGINAQELTNNGYVIVNSAASQAQRQIREASPWFFIYVKEGAIQYLPINTVTYY